MLPLQLPVTLATTSAMAVLAVVLAARVGAARGKYKINMGDGGNADLNCRIRTHANFVEYVPLLLVLMGLLELAGGNRTALMYAGIALVILRVLHAVGMPRPAPNPYRATGAIGSLLLLLIGAVYGFVLVFNA